ncbi:unnamed protein product [Leptosia nina]|uniref:Uncharacterized protein n=1 Tax=Leptosia nina TaxID=320188 RepID=A0AAV1JX57_9NEOP
MRKACKTVDREKKHTDGWFVRGHCCVSAASQIVAAARWRGARPPTARIRGEPGSGATRAYHRSTSPKLRPDPTNTRTPINKCKDNPTAQQLKPA